MTPGESVRSLGSVFDLAAEAYDAVRPGYPASLIDLAIKRGGLAAGSRVLEVGCGTGKLTELLVARGLRVDAVDPGPNMIATAQRRLGHTHAVTFHLGRFEDVELPHQPFDAVFSATAFHWVDPAVGWAKAAAHLKAGGLLALLSHVIRRDEQSRAIQDEFLAVLRRHAPELAAEWRQSAEFDAVLAGVAERRGNVSEMWDWLMQGGLRRPAMAVPEAAGLYEDVEVASEAYTVDETADELIALLRTTSLYHRIDPASREAFEEDHRRVVERLGGVARHSLAVVLMTARRQAAAAPGDFNRSSSSPTS
jgi:ubiquinone/menaquinone biosynthesis C-methylase UbiE